MRKLKKCQKISGAEKNAKRYVLRCGFLSVYSVKRGPSGVFWPFWRVPGRPDQNHSEPNFFDFFRFLRFRIRTKIFNMILFFRTFKNLTRIFKKQTSDHFYFFILWGVRFPERCIFTNQKIWCKFLCFQFCVLIYQFRFQLLYVYLFVLALFLLFFTWTHLAGSGLSLWSLIAKP